MTAAGEEPAGLMITVTFAGTIDRTLGRDALKDGLVAVILEPKGPGYAPAVVATEGAGDLGYVLSQTESKDVGVIRKKNQLLFFIGGPGASQVGAVVVKAFTHIAGVGRAKAAAGQTIFDEIESQVPFEEQRLSSAGLALYDSRDCLGLRKFYSGVTDYLSWLKGVRGALEKLRSYDDRRIEQLTADTGASRRLAVGLVQGWFAPLGIAFRLITGETPRQNLSSDLGALRTFKLDRRLIEASSRRSTR